jgi:hypothetical protein
VPHFRQAPAEAAVTATHSVQTTTRSWLEASSQSAEKWEYCHRAAETIFALASPTLPGCTVTAGAGRTRYADWLEDALVRALLPDDPTPPGR